MLLECVPNVSEGRDAALIARLADAAGRDAALLDRSSDPDHHRTVLTLAGSPQALHHALLRLYEVALAGIDLRRHQGVHPRLGAVDVVPFVPLDSTPTAVAVAAAERLGAAVAERFGLPVWLYEEAARPGRRRALPAIRRGGLDGLARRLAAGERPDFGPAALHPTAGATVIGARPILIAFNVVLASDDLALARRIAAAVRQRAPGGLPAVRALGVPLPQRGLVQVSMNLLDYRRTPPRAAFDRVRAAAAASGVRVLESELVGLVPRAALSEEDAEHVRLREFSPERYLETRLAAAGLAAASGGDEKGIDRPANP